MSPRRIASLLALFALSGTLSACGSQGINVRGDTAAEDGARLFAERCSGCHTLDVAGTEGSSVDTHDPELTDGPNFNTRKETVDQVLYAIRNGGFSGKIMPQNIVVGEEAQKVAEFLAKYSGTQAKAPQGASE